MVRTLHKLVAKRNRKTLQDYLEPEQLCMSPAGGHKLVHAVRMLMEEHEDWVCVKLDVANAELGKLTKAAPSIGHRRLGVKDAMSSYALKAQARKDREASGAAKAA